MKKICFLDSLPLFLFASIVSWGMSIPLVILGMYIKEYLLIGIFFGIPFILTILLYIDTMSKIEIDEHGIQKSLFKRFNKQYLTWEMIQDLVVITRPNGYVYLVLSQEKIFRTSFAEIKRNKKCLYFTYNQKALDFIEAHIQLKKH